MCARATVLAVALLLSITPVTGRQSDQRTLVNQFYPKWLADDSEADFKAGAPPPHRDVVFANADLDATGQATYIVAAFSNGFRGAVSVLAKRGDSAVETSAPRFPLMLGSSPEITLRDLDHDGRPEVIVSFSSAQGNRAQWIFKWDGHALESIADEVDEHGDADAIIVNGLYIDLNGDGVLEIVNSDVDFNPNDPSVVPEYDVYSLTNGKYRLTRTLSFIETFARPKDDGDEPQVETREFGLRDPSSAYEMTIVNGDDDGSHRVTSADIFVNRMIVADTRTLRDRRIVNVRLKKLAASNQIRAVLRGPRQTWLSVFIGPMPERAR